MQLVPVCKWGSPYAYGDTPNFVKIPFAYNNSRMHMGIWQPTRHRMHIVITICIRGTPSFWSNPRMHLRILICIRGSPYAYGVTTTDSSPYIGGDCHMHTVIYLFCQWIPVCIWGSPYAHGDPRMHMGIPVHIWGYNIHHVYVCKWGLPYAYGENHVHIWIPVCIQGCTICKLNNIREPIKPCKSRSVFNIYF